MGCDCDLDLLCCDSGGVEMINPILTVVVAERDSRGDAECYFCEALVWSNVPVNYPQVCHQCAGRYVWHRCNGCPPDAKKE